MDGILDSLVIDLAELDSPGSAPHGAPGVDAATTAVLTFVARQGGAVLYRSPPFLGPHLAADPDPSEQVAPGKNRCLHLLRRDIQRDGWEPCGRGPQPWALHFARPPRAVTAVVPGPSGTGTLPAELAPGPVPPLFRRGSRRGKGARLNGPRPPAP